MKLVIVTLVACVACLTTLLLPETAPEPAVHDVGPFKVGFQRGLERASFTGRPLVKVFVSEPDREALDRVNLVLEDAKVQGLMDAFTGVIVPVPDEPVLTEDELKAREETREARIQAAIERGETLPDEPRIPRFSRAELPAVVIQSLSGPFLAVLTGESLTTDALIAALEKAAGEAAPAKSPLLEACDQNPGVFKDLVERGDIDTVRIARDALAEIAPWSPAHAAAESAIAGK
ncbi:MAG: hypothetical protein HY721_20395 [Planctomycetes bacterium]|nr:hypothetical protein [Planctomycetota bacterium]